MYSVIEKIHMQLRSKYDPIIAPLLNDLNSHLKWTGHKFNREYILSVHTYKVKIYCDYCETHVEISLLMLDDDMRSLPFNHEKMLTEIKYVFNKTPCAPAVPDPEKLCVPSSPSKPTVIKAIISKSIRKNKTRQHHKLKRNKK